MYKPKYKIIKLPTFKFFQSLPDDSIRVVRPIPVLVRPESGAYVVSLGDSAISASGETVEEAVAGLADIIASKFHLFSRKESILGERPRRQLHTLRQYLRSDVDVE